MQQDSEPVRCDFNDTNWWCRQCKEVHSLQASGPQHHRQVLCYSEAGVLQLANYCVKCASTHLNYDHDCFSCRSSDGDRTGKYVMKVDMLAQNSVEHVVHCSEACYSRSQAIHKFDATGEDYFRCDFCGVGGKRLPNCGRCKRAYYCNQQCQRNGWRMHKGVCRKME